jgi:2-dehydropantoate 2-reductase
MMITIAGCGALGSIFASKLLDGGYRVQAYQRQGATLDALKKGLTIESEDRSSSRTYTFSAVSDRVEDLEPTELIIVLVKSFSTAEVAPLKNLLKEGGIVLTLQNGLGNAEILSSIFGEERIAAGTAHWGAIKRAPGVVQEAGGALIVLGPWVAGKDMTRVAHILEEAAFKVKYVEDPRPFIWKKLTINNMVNTCAALTGLNNEGLISSPLILELMKGIGKETVEAAGRAGICLDMEELWPAFLDNIRKTSTNIPSMLQDNMAERRMEVETIPGGVLKYARNKDEFPYTRTMYALLKSLNTHRGYE